MSTKFNTSLTRLLSIRSPIICPPMSGAAGGLLASQVTAAGGFGFMAPTYTTMADFSSQFDIARKTLGISSGPLPIGVGFLGFRLEKTDNEFTRQLLEHALEQQVHAVWLAFGNDLGTWVDYVRNYDAKREHKTLIFIGVSSVSAAVQAANEFKADAIAAQSSDAGGHGMSAAPGTLTLVTSILDALPKESSPPIIAAGGITRPNQVAAMLTLGAAGTAHGTMFLATPASLYKEESKQAIIAADGESTVRSYGFDLLRGTTGWPKGVDGRGIAIKSVQELEGMQQDTTPEGVDLEAMRQGMDKRGEKIVWAGSGVGAIKEIREAADIVRDMHEGTVAVLKNAGSLIMS